MQNTKLLQNACLSSIRKLLLCYILNAKLLRNVCASITKDLLLCYSECQIFMNRLNE
jgi:hypothetical protein